MELFLTQVLENKVLLVEHYPEKLKMPLVKWKNLILDHLDHKIREDHLFAKNIQSFIISSRVEMMD
jgi:hypothetical protein